MAASLSQDALRAYDRNESLQQTSEHYSSDVEKPLRYTTTDTEASYPEGGRDAWLVVLGAWCGLTASLGVYNTTGVFQVVISKVLLPDYAPSTLGWLFSVYAFVNWVCGVQVGPTFDAMGPRALIAAGTVCTLVGIFAFSVCTGTSLGIRCKARLLANVDRILPDVSGILHLNRDRLIPSSHPVNGLRRSLVHGASRPRQRLSIHRRRLRRRSLPADDTIAPLSGRLGMVNPNSRICAPRAVRCQRGILSQQSSSAQRRRNLLARYNAGPADLHGRNWRHGSHHRWRPLNGPGLLHTHHLHAELLH